MRLLVVAYCCCTAPLFAQDMPLFTIAASGTTWTKEKNSSAEVKPQSVSVQSQLGLEYQSKPEKNELLVRKKGSENWQAVAHPVGAVRGLAVIHDGGTLVVADATSHKLWSFAIQADGSLKSGDQNYFLRARRFDGKWVNPNATFLLCDEKDRIYAVTDLGIQVFDPTARLCGVLLFPQNGEVQSIAWTGEKRDQLQVIIDGQIYTRPMLAHAPKK